MPRGVLFAGVLTACLLLAGCAVNLPQDDPAPGEQETIRAGLWTTSEPVPTPRTEVATTILDGELMVIGGIEDGSAPSTTVEALDLDRDEWRDLPDLPVPLHHARAVTVDGTVHVLGGYNGIPFQATPTHLTWAPGDPAWTTSTPLPAPRGAHGAAVVQDEIFLMGGMGEDGELLSTVHAYDTDEGTWTSYAEIPTPREHLAAAALEGAIHAVAGREGGLDTNLDTHEVLTPGDGWEEHEPVPTPRGGLDGANVHGHVIVAGGEEPDGTFDEVEAYDPTTGNWTQLPGMLTPRHGLGVDAWEGSLVTSAGGPDAGLSVSGQVEVLALEVPGSTNDAVTP